MKSFQKLLRVILTALCSFTILCSVAFSQTKTLPKGLNANSTFEEIVEWLNTNSFPKATIGMESGGNYSSDSEDIPNNSTTYFEEAYFASGFRSDTGGTCQRLDLTNDSMNLIYFATKYPDPSEGSLADFRKVKDDQKNFAGEIRIPLEELSYKDGKNTKKGKAFWHSKYRLKTGFGGFFKTAGLIFNRDKAIETIKEQQENGMQFRVRGTGTNGRDEAFYGSSLIFRFEDKAASENFDSAFRQLIKVCSKK